MVYIAATARILDRSWATAAAVAERAGRTKKRMEEGKGPREEECRSLLRLLHASWTKTWRPLGPLLTCSPSVATRGLSSLARVRRDAAFLRTKEYAPIREVSVCACRSRRFGRECAWPLQENRCRERISPRASNSPLFAPACCQLRKISVAIFRRHDYLPSNKVSFQSYYLISDI